MRRQYLVIILAAMSAIAAATALSGEIKLFLNPAGLLLVIGGTLVGLFVAFPLSTLQELWLQLKSLRNQAALDLDQLVELFAGLARLNRTSGVRAVEEAALRFGHPLLELGVAQVVDNRRPLEIRERMEQEFDFFLSRREAQRSVLSLTGRLAPAFGLAGTMIGLIRMLNEVSDPTAVASGMSVALLTTFYGIMLANLIVLPLERKIKERNRAEAVEMTLVIEGVLALARGENAAGISARLRSFRQASPPERPRISATRFARNNAGIMPAPAPKESADVR